ncbi:MAG: hypothetical protein ABR582_04460 [Gemmatimonadaceae bacterium]
MKRIVCVAIVLAASGCGKPHAPVTQPLAAEFASAIEAARQKVDAGDYPGADKILADYSLRHQGTPEAREISFWRAMYIVDPANRTASIAQGIRALDIYLATDGTIWYRPQAEVLRRTALVIQQVRQAQMPKQVTGKDTVFISREEEVAALRDQLAKANAELDRIKKRLANPGR